MGRTVTTHNSPNTTTERKKQEMSTMNSTRPESSAQRSPSKRQVRHVYAREDGELARAMGVQVRMLCGVWEWPRTVASATAVTSADLTVGHCKRCDRVVAAEERRYLKDAKASK